MDTTMMIAGVTALFAVSFLFFAMLVSGEGGSGLRHNPGVFKTGNPTLGGTSSTLGLSRGHVDVPATLEAGRQGVTPRPR